MSSLILNTKHPETGWGRGILFTPAFWLDDFFGPHRYAIVFLDGEVFELDKLDPNYRNQKWVTEKSGASWKDFPNYNKLRMNDGSKLPLTKKELIKQYPWLKSSR